MNIYKYKYLNQDDSLLCEEWIKDDMNYKFSLELQKQFYFFNNGIVDTKWNHNYIRSISAKMKFVKIFEGEYYYKISSIIDDSDTRWDEW